MHLRAMHCPNICAAKKHMVGKPYLLQGMVFNQAVRFLLLVGLVVMQTYCHKVGCASLWQHASNQRHATRSHPRWQLIAQPHWHAKP